MARHSISPFLAHPLPLLPSNCVRINDSLSFVADDHSLVYFLYLDPIHSHPSDDPHARDVALAMFVDLGLASVADLALAHGLHRRTVSRALAARRQGLHAAPPPPGPRLLSPLRDPDLRFLAASLLRSGLSLRKAALQLGVNHQTLHRYRQLGHLPGLPALPPASTLPPSLPTSDLPPSSTPAQRNQRDAKAADSLGMGAHHVADRVAASMGAAGAPLPRFEPAQSVANGGLLLALPNLLQAGLLDHANHLPPLSGFYSSTTVLLLHSLLLLARVPCFQQLRRQQPGEWGTLLGLDRCCHAETLRRKTALLAHSPPKVLAWLERLASQWIAEDRTAVAALYIDGHHAEYSGKARLPVHYIASKGVNRPAVSNYWVHALGGAPLQSRHHQVDPGMVSAIQAGILPALQEWGLAPPPRQADPQRPQVTLAFDREGWSQDLFQHLLQHGVACVTWRKGPYQPWPLTDFQPTDIHLRTPLGIETARGALAEHPLTLQEKDNAAMEVREIRFWINERQPLAGRSGQPRQARPQSGRPDPDARQASIVTTHPDLPAKEVVGLLRSRWSQENCFRYMRSEFGLDSVPEHAPVEVDPSTRVVNPDRRVVQNCIEKLRSKACQLHRKAARLKDRKARAEARRAMQNAERQLQGLEHVRGHMPTYVAAGDLPEDARKQALPDSRRYLLDGLRMIAYRAETALARALAPLMGKPSEVRSLLRQLFRTPASLLPDPDQGTLTVRLDHLTCRADDTAVGELMASLNRTGTLFPNTSLRLVFQRWDGSVPSPQSD